MIPVFRKGTWISYKAPIDQGWSPALTLRAASLYASAVTQGHSPQFASVLAECSITKDLYGVTYDSTIEKALQALQV